MLKAASAQIKEEHWAKSSIICPHLYYQSQVFKTFPLSDADEEIQMCSWHFMMEAETGKYFTPEIFKHE